MACSCGGGRAPSTPQIVGYDYTPPGGGETVRLSKAEADKAVRRNGGGTVVPVRR